MSNSRSEAEKQKERERSIKKYQARKLKYPGLTNSQIAEIIKEETQKKKQQKINDTIKEPFFPEGPKEINGKLTLRGACEILNVDPTVLMFRSMDNLAPPYVFTRTNKVLYDKQQIEKYKETGKW